MRNDAGHIRLDKFCPSISRNTAIEILLYCNGITSFSYLKANTSLGIQLRMLYTEGTKAPIGANEIH